MCYKLVLKIQLTYRVLAGLVDWVRGVGVTLLHALVGGVVGVRVRGGVSRVGQGGQRGEGRGWGCLVTPLRQSQVLQLTQHVVEAGVEVVRQSDGQRGEV